MDPIEAGGLPGLVVGAFLSEGSEGQPILWFPFFFISTSIGPGQRGPQISWARRES